MSGPEPERRRERAPAQARGPNDYEAPFFSPPAEGRALPNPAEGHLVAGGVPQGLEGLRPGEGGLSENPARAADQLRARRELAGRFQIVEDGYQGERLPNQITQAEFERLSNQYSDIRTGNSDLRLDATGLDARQAQEFRQNTMNDIASLMQTESGRALLDQVSDNPTNHTTTLRQQRPGEGIGQDMAPGANAADRANGVGVDTVVTLNCGHSISMPNGEQARSDIVMMHELNHAMHDSQGTSDVGPYTPDPLGRSFRNMEEQAVGLGRYAGDPMTENRYREERRILGEHGRGLPGDERMQPRNDYRIPAWRRPGALDLPPGNTA